MCSRALSFLGILNRGGKTIFGPSLESSLGKLDLLLIAADASGRERMEQKAARIGLKTYIIPHKSSLGEALGYDELSYCGIQGKKEANAFLEKTKGDRHEEK